MVFSLASSLSTAEGLIARGLVSCGNATEDLFSDTTPLQLAAATTCGVPAEVFTDADYEFPADVCTEGDDDECDTVAEIVTKQLCALKTFVTSVEAALADSCDDAYVNTILTASGIKPAAYNLDFLGDFLCSDSDEGGEIAHVCLAGDNPVLDLEELVAEADALADGDSDSDSDGGDAGDGEDSAAGLVAFAGVSLAAAAMLA